MTLDDLHGRWPPSDGGVGGVPHPKFIPSFGPMDPHKWRCAATPPPAFAQLRGRVATLRDGPQRPDLIS